MVAIVVAASAMGSAQGERSWNPALDEAARTAPDARIVVVDIRDGRLLASRHLDEAARTLAAPGSTLKPLILYELLASGRWNAERRVACDRALMVAGHRLACSHPAAPPFDARAALAWSCNSYFAEVARRLHAGELEELLRRTGLLGATGLAPNEAVAEFREPNSQQDLQLTVLGVENIRITPLELTAAYRWLAAEFAAYSETIATITVRAGIADSAESGMAQPASTGAVSVAGKTGTAENAGSHRTHGWFAGFAPASNPQVVIVVYIPSGRGIDAARVAGMLLAHSPLSATRAKQP